MADLNALQPLENINSYGEMVNKAGAGVINPEVFYTKQLLDTIRLDGNSYLYYRYAEAMPIQEKADKLTVRRWAPLQAHTVPLSEGIPPKSDKTSVEKYEMQAYQYGRYMEFSDRVDYKAVDPIVSMYSREYSIVAIETLDLLAQQALLSIAQKHYAGLATTVDQLTLASKPSIADLRLIILGLKKQLVKPRQNGRFHVIVSPEFVFDMLDDEFIQNYMKLNQTTSPFYEDKSVLIPMFSMEFYEVQNCPDSGVHYNGSGKRVLPVFKSYTGTAPTVGNVVDNVVIVTSVDTTNKIYYGKITESADPYNSSTNPNGTWNIVDGYVKDSRTGQDASYIPNQFIWKIPTGYTELKVQHTFILGQDALKRTGLSGEDNAKMYVKPLGSSGVLDPIDQRQSMGFKINSVGFASVRLEAVVDYMNVPTQLNV